MKIRNYIIFFWHLKSSEKELTIRQGAREQLQIYYEQLKQSIIENDSYVDALFGIIRCDLYGQSKDRYSGEKYYSKGKRAKRTKRCFLIIHYHVIIRDYCAEYERKSHEGDKAEYNMTNDTKNCWRDTTMVTQIFLWNIVFMKMMEVFAGYKNNSYDTDRGIR